VLEPGSTQLITYRLSSRSFAAIGTAHRYVNFIELCRYCLAGDDVGRDGLGKMKHRNKTLGLPPQYPSVYSH